jgi:hypothetical protein
MDLEQPIEEAARDRFQYAVVILILLVTILGAGVALLQRHASVNESRASRETVAKAVEVMGELQRRGQQAAYDVGVTADFAATSMDAIALQGTALELTQAGRREEAIAYQGRAAVLVAQAEALRSHSILLTDPRYAPQGESVTPDVATYMADWQAPIQALLAEQQAAAERANRWGNKADAYTSITTMLAVSVFLYSLSLIIRGRLRYLFALVGSGVVGLALLWVLWALVMG